jgi:hypothetical protein
MARAFAEADIPARPYLAAVGSSGVQLLSQGEAIAA